MDSVAKFYDAFASSYHLIFQDWRKSIDYHARCISKVINSVYSIANTEINILDCSCGIGTQAIGLALLGYNVTGTDISPKAIKRAKKESEKLKTKIDFKVSDFRTLSKDIRRQFDIVISCDNALPHLLLATELVQTFAEISKVLKTGGYFIASIQDYDAIIDEKMTYTEPYIFDQGDRKRIAFQTWDWADDIYTLNQYIIVQRGRNCKTKCFQTKYRAVKRTEITSSLLANSFVDIEWRMPEMTEYYQPLVIARKE